MRERLGRHDVLDLRSADTLRKRGKGAMGGGVRIAADDGHPRQGEALLRTHDMHYALALVGDIKKLDIEPLAVLL